MDPALVSPLASDYADEAVLDRRILLTRTLSISVIQYMSLGSGF